MATPMDLGPEVCVLCYGDSEGGTWDLDGPYRAVLVNVCFACRLWEHRQLILLRSAYVGTGHPTDCGCLECQCVGCGETSGSPDCCRTLL
jgi:hypothetical protein